MPLWHEWLAHHKLSGSAGAGGWHAILCRAAAGDDVDGCHRALNQRDMAHIFLFIVGADFAIIGASAAGLDYVAGGGLYRNIAAALCGGIAALVQCYMAGLGYCILRDGSCIE